MPAKVIIRHVPEWFGEREPFVRAEVRRAVQRSASTSEIQGIENEKSAQ